MDGERRLARGRPGPAPVSAFPSPGWGTRDRRAAHGVKRSFPGALVIAALAASAGTAISAETLPPPPAAYFNDYAGLVPAADAQRLDAKLRQFAEETSTQVVVVVFPNLPSPSLEDFTVRAAQSWRVGRKDWDNGAVLFVFVNDRTMRIETGYGLEGALPDQLAGRILDEQVRPRFRAGDWTGGLEAGIDGILAATRGEYEAPPKKAPEVPIVPILILVFFVILLLWLAAQGSRHVYVERTYGSRGFRRGGGYWGGGSSWGDGSASSGGGGGFSGGGFSGGGGSFGGGGASSSW
jgi:uncharacterized protein